MNYGLIKYHVTEDGIGCRTALFVSGCRHHCKECFQPQTWDFNYGQPFDEDAENKILESMKDSYVTGLSLLGGEPFEPENQKGLINFLRKFKELYPNKSIWAYSGYTYEELTNNDTTCHTEYTNEILSFLDVLIDGEFEIDKKNLMLPFRGSENQRVIDMKETIKNNQVTLSEYHFRKKLGK